MSDIAEKLREYGDLLPLEGFKVVTIHPLADEFDLLERLNMSPDECTSVDFYWVFHNEIIFVTLWCSKDNQTSVNFYIRDNMISFYVRTNICPIATIVVQNVLQNLQVWLLNNSHIRAKIKQKDKPITISNLDFGISET